MTIVDASVFVAIYRPQDPFHQQSRARLLGWQATAPGFHHPGAVCSKDLVLLRAL